MVARSRAFNLVQSTPARLRDLAKLGAILREIGSRPVTEKCAPVTSRLCQFRPCWGAFAAKEGQQEEEYLSFLPPCLTNGLIRMMGDVRRNCSSFVRVICMIFPQMRSAALAAPDPALTLRACTNGYKLFPPCGSWRCHGLARGD